MGCEEKFVKDSKNTFFIQTEVPNTSSFSLSVMTYQCEKGLLPVEVAIGDHKGPRQPRAIYLSQSLLKLMVHLQSSEPQQDFHLPNALLDAMKIPDTGFPGFSKIPFVFFISIGHFADTL